MSETVDFCTTAMIRPELLRRTYESFTEKLLDIPWDDTQLFLNVDPLPPGDAEKVVAVAKEFFGHVTSRTPDKPNFAAAVKWCWSSAGAPFLFHLEDDWVLRRPVSINALLEHFGTKKEGVMQIALRAYRYKYRMYCLSPGIFRAALYKRMAPQFDTSVNPEFQLHALKHSPKTVRGYTDIGTRPLVADIGREWIIGKPYAKVRGKGRKRTFITWDHPG